MQAQQKIKDLGIEIDKKEEERKRMEVSYKGRVEELEKDLRNVEGNLSRLLQVNSLLEAEKQ